MESFLDSAPRGWRSVFRAFAKTHPDDARNIGIHLDSHHERRFPPRDLVFHAFELTPFRKVRVVVIGQDPYHGSGEAMGLAFSVPDGVKIPPSLVRVFKEIQDSVSSTKITGTSGNLESWAKQGVLLLNSALTVEEHSPGSHMEVWTKFTDFIVERLSVKRINLVFMLWGVPAKRKGENIKNRGKHLALEAGHPSPLNPHGFAGCKHFLKCNNYLQSLGQPPVDWSVR